MSDLIPMSAFQPSGALWLPPRSVKQPEQVKSPADASADDPETSSGMSEHTLDHLCQMFYGESELGLCGCGNPEHAWQLIASLLNLAPFYEHPDAVTELIGQHGAYHIVLSALTRADLIEHGGSIGGSWLTPKGKWCQRALAGVTDWEVFCRAIDEDAGFPDQCQDGCTDACWEVQP